MTITPIRNDENQIVLFDANASQESQQEETAISLFVRNFICCPQSNMIKQDLIDYVSHTSTKALEQDLRMALRKKGMLAKDLKQLVLDAELTGPEATRLESAVYRLAEREDLELKVEKGAELIQMQREHIYAYVHALKETQVELQTVIGQNQELKEENMAAKQLARSQIDRLEQQNTSFADHVQTLDKKIMQQGRLIAALRSDGRARDVKEETCKELLKTGRGVLPGVVLAAGTAALGQPITGGILLGTEVFNAMMSISCIIRKHNQKLAETHSSRPL